MKPSDFNRKIKLGHTEDVLDESGNFYNSEFISDLTLWCAPRTRTLNQQYQIMNTELQDTIVVVIRHNSAVNDTYAVRYQNQDYQIVSISPDDSNKFITYDFITLRKVKKAGS